MALRPPLRTLAAVAEAILPEGGAFTEGARTLDVAGRMGRAWPELQPQARRTVVALTAVLDAAALARTGHRLAGLPPARRLALCETWETRSREPLRSAFLGVKTLVLVLCGDDPRLAARLGSAGWPPQVLGGP